MARSIMQTEKECYVCGSTYGLEEHHVIYGTANRKLSEKYGLKVWLCHAHHTGSAGVHFNRDLDMQLKKYAQECFELKYGANMSFREVFGKNYKEE
ncbi:MAG: hypothetical protein KBT34_09995 [Prevotella sp.]|nr:hypothetical protein [Candidatus Prevotella equi]